MAETPDPDVQPEINQPGLSRLREVVAETYSSLEMPSRLSLRQDALAGLNSALGSAPDGMANSLLAGVNPIYGLYATMVGPIVAGLLSSTQLMVVTATSAGALAANDALGGLTGASRDSRLFLLVIIVGVFQVLFGVLRLGRLINFVSYSVMTGFLTGIAMLMILSQIPTITGYAAEGENKVAETLDVVAHWSEIDLITLAMAGLTLLLILTLRRTPLRNVGALLAIIVPSVLVALFGWDSVRTVNDVGEIPRGLPEFYIPSLSDLSFETITGALAVSAILLVQAAGVSQSVPNPDGSRINMSRDFWAQGAANVVAGFFRGLPVGGSLSSTALSIVAGPRSRLAAIFTGVWMAAVVFVFPGLVAYIAMPALGALLIHAGTTMIKPSEVLSIWKTGWAPRLVIITTFLATLFLPIQAAVGIGSVLSALLYLNNSSTDISLVQLVKNDDGRIREQQPPARLPANRVTVLDVYGHLFYAGARTLERLLPEVGGAEKTVVVLRLRGQPTIGATLIEVLAKYADQLRAVGGRLYLTGITEAVYDQVVRTDKLRLTGPVRAYEATETLLQSTEEAVAEARMWLVGQGVEPPGGQ